MIRVIDGVAFECHSPSVWHARDLPVTIAFDGRRWRLSLINSLNRRVEAEFNSRDEAFNCVTENYRRTGT